MTLEEYQSQLQMLQAQMTQEIQAAQQSGDFVKMVSIGQAFQEKIQALAAAYSAGTSPAPEPKNPEPLRFAAEPAVAAPATQTRHVRYEHKACAIDLNAVVYDGERDTRGSLEADGSFMTITDKLLKNDSAFNSRKHLLKRALHLLPSIAPKVYEVIDVCKKNLNLTMDLDVYVYQDTAFNAMCYPSDNTRVYVLLTSALLERFSREELIFVLGHEIGHTLFNHHLFPVQYLLKEGRDDYSPVHALRLYSWNRGCELTADRIGLLCARDFEAAGSAFFKLSSGITDHSLSFHLDSYLRQFDDLSNELKNSKVDPEDMYSSHPFSPLRLKALEIFHKSETYRGLIGESGGQISESDMERDIRSFMQLVEPSILQEDSESTAVAREYLFYCGYAVAAANGHVDDAEIRSLASILDREVFEKGMATVNGKSVEDLLTLIAEKTEKINMLLPVVGKLNAIRDLVVISNSDGEIDDAEMAVLEKICGYLHIRPQFIDQVINTLESEAA